MRAIACCLGLLVAVGGARGDEDARAVFDRGTALFALHHFAEAAAAYEKAFELRPDPAILYNAAQAHRLAGNKQRALDLYQSLLRLYGAQLSNRAEIDGHVRQLGVALEAERRAIRSPPVVPKPRPMDSRPTTTRTPPTETNANANVSVSATAPPVELAVVRTPVTKRRWFWPVVGVGIAAVVAGVTVGIVLGSTKTVPPSASFGAVRGN
jgi:Tetratricopeptide repeat